MASSRKQAIAMAAIVVLGLAAAGAVLTAQGPATGATAEAAAPVAAADPRELRLDDAQAKAANIGTQTAGPGQIQAAARFEGELRFN